jgi:hypothetical protein
MQVDNYRQPTMRCVRLKSLESIDPLLPVYAEFFDRLCRPVDGLPNRNRARTREQTGSKR